MVFPDWSQLASAEVFVRNYRDLSEPARRLGSGFLRGWSTDSHVLYISTADSVFRWTVPSDLSGNLIPPIPLFGLNDLGVVENSRFSVAPDGNGFLMNFQITEATVSTVLVQNWKRLLDE